MQASLCRLTCSLSRAVRHASSARTSAAESASAVAKQRDDKSNQTSYPINPRFVNRNPRCLEQLAIAHKRLGWDYQAPLRTYWYKVVFEKSSNNTRAAIVHHQDGEVVSASTREYAVRKHLFSATDLSAAESIARLLARRSLQFGICRVMFDKKETPVENAEFQKRLEAQGIQVVQSAVQVFHDTLIANGLCLEEAAVRLAPEQIGIDYDSLSEPEKRSLRPSLIYQLRTKVDKSKLSRYPSKMRPLPSEELAKPYRRRLLFDNTSDVAKRRDLLL